ncbi:MAG: hypothetical protein R2844_00475 [Caldilineales bacterium]
MKTISRVGLLLVFVALTAAPAMAGGGAITFTDHGEELDWYAPDTFVCLGAEPGDISEMVDMYVDYRWVSHTTITPDGGYTIRYSDSNRGTGIGRITGNHYANQWNWHYQETGHVGHTLQVNGTLIWRNLDTGQTQRSNHMVHITVNANGTVTVDHEDPWPPDAMCFH